MFKTITFIKRRSGLSMAAFMEGYETHHRKIGEKHLAGLASRYVRRYLQPMPSSRPAATPEPDVDVVLEIWYPDRAAFEAAILHLQSPDVAAEIAADEERWFDRASIRSFSVEERESSLPASASGA